MCDKHCQTNTLHTSEPFRPHGTTTVRLSDNETLVVESGPTTVTICNGEVEIHSKYDVAYTVEDRASFKLAEHEEPQQQPRQDITQPEFSVSNGTQLQYTEWQTPKEAAPSFDEPASVCETSSTDGEEDIPSS